MKIKELLTEKELHEIAGGMGASAVATAYAGGGNGFVNGGPGTISRAGSVEPNKKKKKKKKA